MKISLYITSYGQENYLGEAIESALAQTLKPFEIVIVDDNSTDGSKQLIAGFHSRYPDLVLPIYHSRNTGVAQTRVDALRAVRGDYVTYVDGDDRLLPTKLEREGRLLRETPDAQLCFSNFHYIDEDGAQTGTWAELEKPPTGNVFCQTFARDFPRRTLFRSELVNYQAWKSVGFHDSKLPLYEDYDMRIRLTQHLRVVYCDEVLSEYRVHRRGLHRTQRTQHLQALRYIYRKNKPLLDHLDEAERAYVKRRFRGWVAGMVWRGITESLGDREFVQAAELALAAARCARELFIDAVLGTDSHS